MKKVRLVFGVDISMDEFHVCAKTESVHGEVKIKGTHTFGNTVKGFDDFYCWVKKLASGGESVFFVMEATGVYFEDLAYFLHEHGEHVSVVLPNKIKNFAKSLNVKTKTDKVDSKTIAQFGIERGQEKWFPLSPHYRELRDLCRELLSIKKDRVRAKNQLHAINHSFGKSSRIVKLKEEQIGFYEAKICEIEEAIMQLASEDPALMEKLARLETIPGIKFLTAVMLASETNGFKLFQNIRQLVSYAGLDVKFNDSGKFKGKASITKKGNSRIRQVLYMPALSAIQHNEPIKRLHERVCEKNPQVRQKGVVAGMRKLLIYTYIIWKKKEVYDKNYVWTPKTSGNDETKPSFGHLAEPKKRGKNCPALDRLRYKEPTEAFFWSEQR